MSAEAWVEPEAHPVTLFAGQAHEALDGLLVAGARLAALGPEETADAVVELARLAARVEAVRLALVAHGDTVDVATEAVPTVATSTATWLAQATRIPVRDARRDVALGLALDRRYAATAHAALAGEVDGAQAKVIADAVDALPRWVSRHDRARAEAHLLGLAADHDARALKVLARHLLHVIDPDAADAELGRQLEREEAAARARTVFRMADLGDGTHRGTFRIPALHAAMLAAALHALASPHRPDPIARQAPDQDGDPQPRTTDAVLGEAFAELIERCPATRLPQTGGGLATVLVTIPLATLQQGLGAATLSTGGHLSVGAVRRLACHAGIIPQVLGSRSELLDQGRRARLHTPAQRIAMATRDRTCTAEGCTIPTAWCHAHHDIPWSRNGPTSVANGRMLCPRHHRLLHQPGFTHQPIPGGRIRITRTRVDRQ